MSYESTITILLNRNESVQMLLFSLQLRDGEVYPVLSSIRENEGTFFFKGVQTNRSYSNAVHLIDYPGHARYAPIRKQSLLCR